MRSGRGRGEDLEQKREVKKKGAELQNTGVRLNWGSKKKGEKVRSREKMIVKKGKTDELSKVLMVQREF